VQIPSGVLFGFLFEFVNDLLVAIFYYKDIMKEHRGQAVDSKCEQDRFHSGFEPVMLDKMEVKRFQQEKPSAGAEREQVHSLDPGVERLPVLT